MSINKELIQKTSVGQQRQDIPEYRTGDTVKAHLRIVEGSKSRVQVFEGFILKSSGAGNDATITIRKESYGIGVEKTIFVNSPNLVKLEVTKPGKVRKSRVYYMRDRKGKSARIKPRETK